MEATEENELIRHEANNPYNYTEQEKAEKENTIETFTKRFPHLPTTWIDWCYDFVKNTSEADLELYKKKPIEPSTRTLPKKFNFFN